MRVVLTKCDRPPATDYDGPAIRHQQPTAARGWIELRDNTAPGGHVPAGRRRGRQHPPAAANRCAWPPRRLARAREADAAGAGEELVAIDVRQALDEIGKVVGAVYTDDVLDVIFSRFCIGK